MKSYRWDRRRAKKQRRKPFVRVSAFDAIMLFLIFCLGLWFFYSFFFFTFPTSFCFEQVTAFGQTPITPTVFKSMYFICLALFVFWSCGLFVKRKGESSWFRFAWDGITGFSIVIMCGLYFHLSTWNDLQAPDGTLGIGEGVWVTEGGAREWRKLPPLQIPLSWTDGKVAYFTDYHAQECVWLDENQIAITGEAPTTALSLDQYVAKIQSEILREGPKYLLDPPEWLKFHQTIAIFFKPRIRLSENLKTQNTRPLTPEERQRFLDKQACIKSAFDPSVANSTNRMRIAEKCDPAQVPYWPDGVW